MKTQTETKHTPGPWVSEPGFSKGQNTIKITHESNGLRSHVANIFDNSMCAEHGTIESNARLIAAAPALLAALRALTAIVNGAKVSSLERERHLEKARAAIARAEGRDS